MKQLFQFRSAGKKFLLPAIALIMSTALSAQPLYEKPLVQSKEIRVPLTYNEVEVIGDVTIVLTNNLDGRILFRGEPGEVQQAKAIVKKRKLIIHANPKGKSGKFTVYMPTSNISLLTTSGKTEILSSGTISIRNLEIFLNGSSFVSVRHDGKLNVVAGAGFEVIHNKN